MRLFSSTSHRFLEEPMHKKTLASLAAGVTVTTGLGIALAMPASADHGGGSSRQGDCSMGSTWELRASANGDHDGVRRDDHGHHHGIEVEFRIRTDENGDTWNWMISDNGTVVKQGSARAHDDDIERRRNVANLEGPDTIVLNATDTVTGETCEGQVVVRGDHHR
jgi:hypothetical protein